MSATTSKDFIKDFDNDFRTLFTQATNEMISKYLPRAYKFYHIVHIYELIDKATYNRCCNDELHKIMPETSHEEGVCITKLIVTGKRQWFINMKGVIDYINQTVSNKKCNSCNIFYLDCRNTCIKRKINPRPIEFPQDVFNVVKDYLGIYDIPQEYIDVMDNMKAHNLTPDVITFKKKCITKCKELSVKKRVEIYKMRTINIARKDTNKKLINNHKSNVYRVSNRSYELCVNYLDDMTYYYKEPVSFGKELTYNNKLFLINLLYSPYCGFDNADPRRLHSCLKYIMTGQHGYTKNKYVYKFNRKINSN
jgi:hypothetical protein